MLARLDIQLRASERIADNEMADVYTVPVQSRAGGRHIGRCDDVRRLRSRGDCSSGSSVVSNVLLA